MQARSGDRLIVESNRVGDADRAAEILEATPVGSRLRLRVRWDDGHESVMFPGSDARVEPGAMPMPRVGAVERRMARIELNVTEDADHCEATAQLTTNDTVFSGWGRARRNPRDPNVPMIGEELAIARALGDLSSKLLSAAADAIERHESRPVHLV